MYIRINDEELDVVVNIKNSTSLVVLGIKILFNCIEHFIRTRQDK